MIELTLDRHRTVRVGPWHGRADIASLATYLDRPLDRAAVEECCRRLVELGYAEVITAALDPREQVAFLACGFTIRRDLTLLRRDLDDRIDRPSVPLRRLRRRHADRVLDVDRAAFDDFWRFDAGALDEAIAATPHRLLRIVDTDPIEGYALTGLSQARGYLQRLAVHPDAAGRGYGTALITDALRWLRLRGALSIDVNTQSDNERALTLYHRLGFTEVAGGLAMLGRTLSP